MAHAAEFGRKAPEPRLLQRELSFTVEHRRLILPGDITADSTRREIIDLTLATYKRIDVLVNNAGVGLYDLPSSVSIDLSRRLFEVNVFAALAMAQLGDPRDAESRGRDDR